jgi:hypothetical protein
MDLDTGDEEVNRSPFAEGQDYDSLKALKLAVQTWAIQEVFEFRTLRSNKTRWELGCKGENCGWRIYATSIGGAGNMFRIKVYDWKHYLQLSGMAIYGIPLQSRTFSHPHSSIVRSRLH